MRRVKLSVVCTPLLVLGVLALGACSSTPADRTATMNPAAIYEEAQGEMKAGQWDKAAVLLEKLEGRAAGTPLAQQAELDKAYAYYKATETAQALAALERFVKLHPASPALDYALYLKGLVNFHDDLGLFSGVIGQDLSERDQKASKESFEAFKELVSRFPDSIYAEDSKLRMKYIVNSLAKYEVHVARYYFKRGAYLAAINRAQLAVTDYQDVPAIEEALFILYKAYDALNMPQLRDDAKRVLERTYPNSSFLAQNTSTQASSWWKFW